MHGTIPTKDVNATRAVARELPYLRRYARALCGSQEAGDHHVRNCLEVLLQDWSALVAPAQDVRLGLFRLFHDLTLPFEALDDDAGLPMRSRQLLLLVQIERFSLHEAAEILRMDYAEAVICCRAAQTQLRYRPALRALVMEDEPLVAAYVADVLEDMGHQVIATVKNQADAVAMARHRRPDLVVSGCASGHGGDGYAAVQKLLSSVPMPVVFVTDTPETLLTGDRHEPSFIVTKPFDDMTLMTTVTLAVLCGRSRAPVPLAAE
ncbi:MAG: response regulator [Alphaproteobacteria bacterium]